MYEHFRTFHARYYFFQFLLSSICKKIRRGLYKILNILHKRGFEGGKQSIKLSEEFDRISPITA